MFRCTHFVVSSHPVQFKVFMVWAKEMRENAGSLCLWKTRGFSALFLFVNAVSPSRSTTVPFLGRTPNHCPICSRSENAVRQTAQRTMGGQEIPPAAESTVVDKNQCPHSFLIGPWFEQEEAFPPSIRELWNGSAPLLPQIKTCKRLKVSFHETWLVELGEEEDQPASPDADASKNTHAALVDLEELLPDIRDRRKPAGGSVDPRIKVVEPEVVVCQCQFPFQFLLAVFSVFSRRFSSCSPFS